jgi:hypothetical protein
MAANLTKPLIVPRWDSQDVVFYTPGTQTSPLGQPVLNPRFTVDQTVFEPLFENAPSFPNVCTVNGADLYVAVSGDAAGIVKLPNYLGDPVTAKSNAFVIDLAQNDYVGVVLDVAGTDLYAAVGPFYPNNSLYRYPGAGSTTAAVAGIDLGNAGQTSYFGNLVFDAAGNLWASDYLNNRLVVFAAAGLTGAGPATWLALTNPASAGTTLAVANTAAGFPATVTALLASPEGLDFDGYGASANLWVANNNDGFNAEQIKTPNTTLVQITGGLIAKLQGLLATQPNSSVSITSFTANVDFRIYQLPNYPSAAGSTQRPQLGGLQIDKATGLLYVNDETNDPGNGWVRTYNLASLATLADDPTDTSSEVLSNAVTSQSGNGGIALVGLGAYIGDTAADTMAALEPDPSATTAPNVPWESPNIVATIEDVAGLTVLPVPYADPQIGLGADGTDTVLGGIERYIYVQVNNFGPRATAGLEELHLYWGKASATLNWPQPWDGNAPPDPQAGLPVGHIIPVPAGLQTVPSIPGFGQVIIGPVPWTTPDPLQYSVQDGHFCLLARLVTPNANYAENAPQDSASPADSSLLAFAGMSFPEASGLNTNVVNNARIAWRNIHIIATEPGGGGGTGGPAIRLPPGVSLTNHGRVPLHLTINFEVLDEAAQPLRELRGPLAILARGKALETLERSALGPLHRPDPARPHEAWHALPDHRIGIADLPLAAHETLLFHIAYAAPEATNYAIRAKVFDTIRGEARLIGGQTFVYGHVAGINRRPHDHHG